MHFLADQKNEWRAQTEAYADPHTCNLGDKTEASFLLTRQKPAARMRP